MKPKNSGKLRLNLGSGPGRIDGFLNVDNFKKNNPDVLADLNKDFPFESGSVDEILADNILEHVDEPVHFLNECHRVLRRNGIVCIRVPSFKEPTAYLPQHKTVFSRKWFTLGLQENFAGIKHFKIRHVEFLFSRKKVFFLNWLYNLLPDWSERFLWHAGYEVVLEKIDLV